MRLALGMCYSPRMNKLWIAVVAVVVLVVVFATGAPATENSGQRLRALERQVADLQCQVAQLQGKPVYWRKGACLVRFVGIR